MLWVSHLLNGLWLLDDYVFPEWQEPPGQVVMFHVNSFCNKQVTLVSSKQFVSRVLASRNQRDCSKVNCQDYSHSRFGSSIYVCVFIYLQNGLG